MTRALIVAALLAACDRSAVPPPPPPPSPAASAHALAPAGFAIPRTTTQLVTAIVDDWTSTHARLALWQRTGTGWERIGEPWPAVIGATGAAWGVGLHPAGREGPVKREGDGKSPAGVFALRGSYGYADEAPRGSRLPYEPSTDLLCVDDPASEQYTKIVDLRQVPSDWASAEQMRRPDGLYAWVIDIAHNPDAKPGLGSCIFFHVWSGPESTTVGCTAMDRSALEALLGRLDPAAHPLYVLLPRAAYAEVAPAWGLPAQ